jgi:hypothetical protein
MGRVDSIETGTVGILNVGEGDTKLSFDPKNPIERIRAARIVKDMLRRGYVLLIEVDKGGEKVFTRAQEFDETVCEYVIADFDPIEAAIADTKGASDGQKQEENRQPPPPPPAAKPAGKRTKRLKAESARAVAVAATAGG